VTNTPKSFLLQVQSIWSIRPVPLEYHDWVSNFSYQSRRWWTLANSFSHYICSPRPYT